jgi:hypothetical protein
MEMQDSHQKGAAETNARAKWFGHPNLRRRPEAPNAGRGRLQTQITRAFIAAGPVVSSTQVYDWAFARRSQMRRSHLNRRRVWQLLREIAEPAGRASTRGRPWLWRLKSPEKGVRGLPSAYRKAKQCVLPSKDGLSA